MSQPLLRYLNPNWRFVLALSILFLPIVDSIARSLHFNQNPHRTIHFRPLTFWEMLLEWSVVFAFTLYLSGLSARALKLTPLHLLKSLSLGVLWSLALRLSVFFLVFLPLFFLFFFAPHSLISRYIHGEIKLIKIPIDHWLILYLGIGLLAGLSEELWRRFIFTLMAERFPARFGSLFGLFWLNGAVALIFGFAHLYQGWLGVFACTWLGLFLGFIQIYRKSFWEAAWAHALFDMSSFILLYYLQKLHHFALGGVLLAACFGADSKPTASITNPVFLKTISIPALS